VTLALSARRPQDILASPRLAAYIKRQMQTSVFARPALPSTRECASRMNDAFGGAAPDIRAYEVGQPAPAY